MGEVFCIGDIHGDYHRMTELLVSAGLVNKSHDWSGGDSKLVFVGDYTDRGRNGLAVMKAVIKWQSQAPDTDGDVITLLGNHDAMLLARAGEIQTGQRVNKDLEYVFRCNGGDELEAEAVATNSTYQDWLKSLKAVHVIGSTLFQHADGVIFYREHCDGALSTDGINRKIKSMIATPLGAWHVFYEMTDARYWDMHAYFKHNEIQTAFDQYLADLNVKRVVHGHTGHTYNCAKEYMDGKAINVDGTLSNGYRKHLDRGFVHRL